MPLNLTLIAKNSIPVELEGVTPEKCASTAATEIPRITVFEGNRKVPLGDLFHISGDASDQQLIFHGDLSGVHWIGAGMKSGNIRVEGPAGRHLGSRLAGGTIDVAGDVGGWVAAEMRRGLIRVRGNAGNCAGGSLPGSIRGMSGGTLLIHGNCGDEAGLAMRRGLIAIAGAPGEFAGRNMIAGTLIAGGPCGRRAGAGMRRGTLLLAAGSHTPLLPSFSYSGLVQLPIVQVLQKHLHTLSFPLEHPQLRTRLAVHRGDLAARGLGEILLPPESVA